MKKRISHDKNDETPEAKASWFQSLTLEQRMDMLCEFTDSILAVNPKIAESKDVATSKKSDYFDVFLELLNQKSKQNY